MFLTLISKTSLTVEKAGIMRPKPNQAPQLQSHRLPKQRPLKQLPPQRQQQHHFDTAIRVHAKQEHAWKTTTLIIALVTSRTLEKSVKLESLAQILHVTTESV